jgi:hypothetical protein
MEWRTTGVEEWRRMKEEAEPPGCWDEKYRGRDTYVVRIRSQERTMHMHIPFRKWHSDVIYKVITSLDCMAFSTCYIV